MRYAIILAFLAFTGCEEMGLIDSDPVTYQLSVVSQGGGSVSPSGMNTYEEGEEVEITAEPDEQWLFGSWEGNATGEGSSITVTVDDNMEITAIFARRTYPLNLDIVGQGVIDERIIKEPSQLMDYTAETVVELTAAPDEGWNFHGWSGDLEGDKNPGWIEVAQEREVSATFASWRAQDNPSGENNIQAVDFVDANTGWAVAGGGTVLHTEDGGETWTDQNLEGDALLIDVDFVNDQTGWAAATNTNSIYYTTNGGATWSESGPFEDDITIQAISFTDEHHGWAFGYSWRDGLAFAVVNHTSDGGVTWQRQMEYALEDNHYVFWGGTFIDDQNGWAIGSRYDESTGVIHQTTDGGETWERAENLPTNHTFQYVDVTFADDQTGWVVGTTNAVLYTDDGGSSWQERDVELPLRFTTTLWGVDFMDQDAGMAVGGPGAIFITEDAGETWHLERNPRSSVGSNDVVMMDRLTAWTVGSYDVNRNQGEIMHYSTDEIPENADNSASFTLIGIDGYDLQSRAEADRMKLGRHPAQ